MDYHPYTSMFFAMALWLMVVLWQQVRGILKNV